MIEPFGAESILWDWTSCLSCSQEKVPEGLGIRGLVGRTHGQANNGHWLCIAMAVLGPMDLMVGGVPVDEGRHCD